MHISMQACIPPRLQLPSGCRESILLEDNRSGSALFAEERNMPLLLVRTQLYFDYLLISALTICLFTSGLVHRRRVLHGWWDHSSTFTKGALYSQPPAAASARYSYAVFVP